MRRNVVVSMMFGFRLVIIQAALFGRISTSFVVVAPVSSKTRMITKLYSSSDSLFDISKPLFDIYSLRQWRGDTLAKYNMLNQSEPLRINLGLLAVLVACTLPTLSIDLFGSSLGMMQTSLCAGGAVLAAIVCYDQLQKRILKLNRLELELQALDLQIRLPTTRFADTTFQRPQTVKEAIATTNCRLLVFSASHDDPLWKETLRQLSVLRSRLKQANTYVVVLLDGERADNDWPSLSGASSFTASAENRNAWKSYMIVLRQNAPNDDGSGFLWFGLSNTGRSFGSGTGYMPNLLELLGRHLQPVDVLLPEDANDSSMDEALQTLQSQFYDALKTGNGAVMEKLWIKSNPSVAVSEVIQEGGRLDPWEACLAQGARPASLVLANADSWICSDNDETAYTTCIEFVDNQQSLLALQEWRRNNNDDKDWKLYSHQTIPWTTNVRAGGTLLCDGRGCVSLVGRR